MGIVCVALALSYLAAASPCENDPAGRCLAEGDDRAEDAHLSLLQGSLHLAPV